MRRGGEVRLVPCGRLPDGRVLPWNDDSWQEGIDGAEAHELFSAFLANWTPGELDPRHPLQTGATKLAAIQDENHPRFSMPPASEDSP